MGHVRAAGGPRRRRSGRWALLVLLVTTTAIIGIPGPGTGPVAAAQPSPAGAGSSQLVTVSTAGPTATSGTLSAWDRAADGTWTRVFGPVTAWVGARGVGATSEGAQRTPVGTFALTESFGRQADPGTAMPYFRSDRLDWWDENPSSPTYNTHVRRTTSPGGASENLYTSGAVYDYAVNIGYNLARTPGAGSAFFLHVTDGTPTAGCVAVDRATVVGILRWLDPSRNPAIDIRVGAEWSPDRPPTGSLDIATNQVPGQLQVAGWAADPDAAGRAEAVHVYAFGPGGAAVAATATSTGGSRPDVAAALPWAGPATGWTARLPVTAVGDYQVCAFALDVDPPPTNPLIGCRTVAVRDPFGALDTVTRSGTTMTVHGWALNPDAVGDRVTVHAYDFGPTVRAVAGIADTSRPDVAAVFAGYDARHGFDVVLPVGEPGMHNVCVFAINDKGGSGTNPVLGCRLVTV